MTWWSTAPEPLTRGQRIVLWCTALFVAATRVFARSRSMWEWDEALFALAIRDYDVTLHRPHPPGFPLFIGAAKRKEIVAVGYRPATRREAHGRILRVWRGRHA